MRPNSSKSPGFSPSNYSAEDLKQSNDCNRDTYDVPSVPHLGGSYQAADSLNSSKSSPSNYTAEDLHQSIDHNRSIYNVEHGHAHRPIPYRPEPYFPHLGGSYQAVEGSNTSRFLKSNVSAANQNQAIVVLNRALYNTGCQHAHRPVPYMPVPYFPDFDGSSQAFPFCATYNQPNFAPYVTRFHSPYDNDGHQNRFRLAQQDWRQHFPTTHQNSLGPKQQGQWQHHFPTAHQNSVGPRRQNQWQHHFPTIHQNNLGPRHQGQWQHHFPTTSDRNTYNRYHDNARYIHANSSRSFTPSRPFNGSPNLSIEPGQTVQNQANIRWTRSKFQEIKRSPVYDHKVWQRKDQFQTSTSSYIHAHKDRIRWNGFEESSEPVGGNCEMCKMDFGFAPCYDDSDYNVPHVSVLPCGHAFHSECLESITPEHSTDPSCHICS